MTPQLLFIIIISILVIDFIIDTYVGYLNAKHFDDAIPEALKDVYDEEAYRRSQSYKKENYRFSLISGGFSMALTLAFFLLEGFAWADGVARELSDKPIIIALIFFGIIMLGSDILHTPFS